ncbi:RNA polymerase sigma-70 factor [Fulvitalea axinellae]|uniref:RNA polymerase sigma-70 factor n=1 Tax=Fulvitalea axinellae TaxID=1182444 RepID=A0AAU9D9P5_9BACT|nr:RNA polymerase sigma-70 factor [Fulvitalea axinellae]
MDSAMFRQLFSTHFTDLCLYTLQFVKSPNVAEDIVQESFILLWEKSEKENIEYPKPYLFRITQNKALQYLRASKKNTLPLEEESLANILSPEQALIQEDEFRILEELLDQVPLKSRRMFEMSRTLNMKYTEIATELGVSVKTVEKHISKVLNFLIDGLEKRDIHLRIFFKSSRKQLPKDEVTGLLLAGATLGQFLFDVGG